MTLFWVCAAFAVAGAIGTVTARRPLRAAMSLLVHIIALAGLYLGLHAELLAALQLLVYAGAIVVLFVFVIMLIGPATWVPSSTGGLSLRAMSVAVIGMVASTIAVALGRYEAFFGKSPAHYGTVEGLGGALYREAWVPFELVSITLLVAIVGAVAVARGRTPEEAARARQLRHERAAANAALGDAAGSGGNS